MSDETEITRTGEPETPEVSEAFVSTIAPLLPTPDLREKYARLYRVADKSPKVNVKAKEIQEWDGNQDFILFVDKKGVGHFDIQRGFALKAMRVFDLGKRGIVCTTTELKSGEVLVQTTGEVFDVNQPDRYTTVQGACSTRETTEGLKKGNTRAYHDAVATAETRLLKRGIEELVGAPIINAIIKEIFGGFEVRGAKGRKERNVSPGKDGPPSADDQGPVVDYDEATKEIFQRLAKSISAAKGSGAITHKEMEHWRQRAIDSITGKGAALSVVVREFNELLDERGAPI